MSDVLKLWKSAQVYIATVLIIVSVVWIGSGYGFNHIPLIMESMLLIVFVALAPFALGMVYYFVTKKVSVYFVLSCSLFITTASLWPFFTKARDVQINIDRELVKMQYSLMKGESYSAEYLPENIEEQREMLEKINNGLVTTYNIDRNYMLVLRTLYSGEVFGDETLFSEDGNEKALAFLERLDMEREKHFTHYANEWKNLGSRFSELSRFSFNIKEKIGQWNGRVPYLMRTLENMHSDTKKTVELYQNIIEFCETDKCYYDGYSGSLRAYRDDNGGFFERDELSELVLELETMLMKQKESIVRFEDAKHKANQWLFANGV